MIYKITGYVGQGDFQHQTKRCLSVSNTIKPADLRNVPISSIRENQVALRGVDKEDAQYLSLRHSVGKYGIQLPITVRAKVEDGVEIFEIIDGLHRYSAALDNGLTDIPVSVKDADEVSVLELQIAGNLCKVDTKPAAYADQMKRMFLLNPTMTVAEMAERTSQSPAWVHQRLSLTKLVPEIQALVDDGTIKLANAYALAKLPKDEQPNFIEQAATMENGEFGPTVTNRTKELREAAREGRQAAPQEFQPVAHIRKTSDIKAEFDNPSVGPAILAASGATTAAEGFRSALEWVLQLDSASVEKAKVAYETRKAQQAEAKNKATLEREEKKQREAAEKAQKARAALGLQTV